MNPFLERLPDPILIVGAYGYRNLGDEAILAGLLSKIGPRRVTVVSRNPAETSMLHGVRAVGIGGAVAALRTHASVLIGGGGIFGRDMGRIGRLLPIYGLTALALRRTVVVEGIDLDEHLAPSARALAPLLMRGATRVTVRDRRSAAILEGWGARANVAPDASAWMPAAPPDAGRRALQSTGVDIGRPVVGLALSGVEPRAADAAVAAVIGAMDALPEVQFCFIPMSRHPFVASHDDTAVARRIQSARARLTIVDAALHPATLLSAFGQLSAAVAMRYHAMLFAERAGIPLVPLVYAEKNLRWLRERRIPAVTPSSAELVATLWAALARDERAARVAPVSLLASVAT